MRKETAQGREYLLVENDRARPGHCTIWLLVPTLSATQDCLLHKCSQIIDLEGRVNRCHSVGWQIGFLSQL